MRSVWANDLNDLRPRPFNRAAVHLPYLDNVFGLWLHRSDQVLDWSLLDYTEPYRCWLTTDDPGVDRAASEAEFLDVPYPIAYDTDEAIYVRNLDVATIAVAHTFSTVGISLDSSTVTPIYDPLEPIYVTNDGWQSWLAVVPATTNVIYSPVTGSLEILYRNPAAVVTQYFYPIYNSFDVWGTILATERLDGEGNLDYWKRLQTVLAGPVDASETGVAIDVARRLGTLQTVDWEYDEPYRQLILDVRDLGGGLTETSCGAVTHTFPAAITAGTGLRGTSWAFAGTGILITPATTYGNVDGFSLSFWMHPDLQTTATQSLVSYQDLGFLLVDSWLMASIGSLLASVITVATTTWYCVTFDNYGNLSRVGVNGEILVSESNPWTLTYGTAAWEFGTDYTGRLDEIQASDGSLVYHSNIASRIVVTNGYPAVVVSPLGIVNGLGEVEEDLTAFGTDWITCHAIREPYEVTENGQVAVATAGTYTVSIATLSRKLDDRRPHIRYTTRWWYGVDGVVPDELPYGSYRVLIADGVTAYSLSEYRVLFLTTARGILTDDGYDLLRRLGEPLDWSNRYWDENLFFYDDAPPSAPTPTIWDQDIVYA